MYLRWKLQISLFFCKWETLKIGSVSKTYLPHCSCKALQFSFGCDEWSWSTIRCRIYLLLYFWCYLKSLLLNCEGILWSGDICLFVNLITMLNKNLGLFWLSMSLRILTLTDRSERKSAHSFRKSVYGPGGLYTVTRDRTDFFCISDSVTFQ